MPVEMPINLINKDYLFCVFVDDGGSCCRKPVFSEFQAIKTSSWLVLWKYGLKQII
jgi:hypothetical protein